MAGGTGVEYYFGYKLPENDLLAQDWRSREQTWKSSGIALRFFRENNIPFWEMKNTNNLIGNQSNHNKAYCLSKQSECYPIYLRQANGQQLDLRKTKNRFLVQWFDPRNGGPLSRGSIEFTEGGGKADLGSSPSEPNKDWVVQEAAHIRHR